MKSLFVLLLALLIVATWSPSTTLADPPIATLVANGRAEYRFDYRGDKTGIEIALDTQGVEGIELYIYTPGEIEAAGRGEPLLPVGRGTRGGGHDSLWAGRFNAPGVYKVIVENHTPGAVLYRLAITGGSVTGAGLVLADAPPTNAGFTGQNTLTFSLPHGVGPSSISVLVPVAPITCTHSYQTPSTITSSIKLCPDEIYSPLHLVGDNIALYSDEKHSAIVATGGRQFAVTLDGSYNLVEGVTIQASADAADQGAWLCQYDECIFPTQPRQTILKGGILYGGGILLRGSHSTIHAVTVHGGTIGVATVNGVGNNLLDSQLSDLNGWGSFNIGAKDSYFVGNTINNENHGCTTPDGFKFLHGCETSGWVCLACTGNVIARNHCEGSANCFYMSGERGLASNDNSLVGNYCAGATDNCFEITFSQGNVLRDNVTSADPKTGASCNYPFWIGGSTIYFSDNLWQCSVSVDDAIKLATASTTALTQIMLTDVSTAAKPTPTPVPADDSTGPPRWNRLNGLFN